MQLMFSLMKVLLIFLLAIYTILPITISAWPSSATNWLFIHRSFFFKFLSAIFFKHNQKNIQPFGRRAFFPIACRRRFTSAVLSNRPSTLTVTKCTISSFILVAQEIVTLYFASGVNKGKRSTFSVKLCAS